MNTPSSANGNAAKAKISALLNSPTGFIIKIFTVYATWKAFHYLTRIPETPLFHFWDNVTFTLGSIYASISAKIIPLIFDLTARSEGITIHLNEQKRIMVEDHCLAIPAMIVFTGSILLFPGPPSRKLWFVPLGILGIALINIVRILFTSYIFYFKSRAFFDFNHTYIYVILTYTLVFLLIMWWMNKHAKHQQKA
jgi:exosortase/archaeosortase family protein